MLNVGVKFFRLFALGIGIALPVPAVAQAQFFGSENISAWIDMRGFHTRGEAGWLDQGFGKARFGGRSGTVDAVAGVKLAEATVIWQPRLSNSLTGYVQVVHVPEAASETGINEAFLKWKPVPTSATRYEARAGQFYPPLSLEHDGEGWTTTRTITPSAINSWIGEEVLVRGLEATVRRRFETQEVGLTASLFSGNDTAGTLLAFRGFALHDLRSTDTSRLALPVAQTGFAAKFTRQAPFTNPVAEIDNHEGYYLRLFWRTPYPARFSATYYDNQADPRALIKGQYGWATQFTNIGAYYDYDEKTQVLAQYMTGKTRMGRVQPSGRHAVEAQFHSGYILLSRSVMPDMKLSLRGEYFNVDDRSELAIFSSAETGGAVTFALMTKLNERLDLSAEVMNIQSDRNERRTKSEDPKQSQTILQLNLKLYFQRNAYLQ